MLWHTALPSISLLSCHDFLPQENHHKCGSTGVKVGECGAAELHRRPVSHTAGLGVVLLYKRGLFCGFVPGRGYLRGTGGWASPDRRLSHAQSFGVFSEIWVGSGKRSDSILAGRFARVSHSVSALHPPRFVPVRERMNGSVPHLCARTGWEWPAARAPPPPPITQRGHLTAEMESAALLHEASTFTPLQLNAVYCTFNSFNYIMKSFNIFYYDTSANKVVKSLHYF